MSAIVAGGWVGVEEAARLLGVSTRQVARLGAKGDLHYLARGVVDRASIDDYLRQREASRTRAWSEATAWAAVALLAGLEVDWLGQAQTSRLRTRLRDLAAGRFGASELVGRTRNRAAVTTYESHDFLTTAIRREVFEVGRRGLGLADAGSDRVDGYLTAERLAELERRYGLRRDARGSMVLRATAFDLAVVDRLARHTEGVLAALDAAGSLDPRERGVGERVLGSHLSRFGHGRTDAAP